MLVVINLGIYSDQPLSDVQFQDDLELGTSHVEMAL